MSNDIILETKLVAEIKGDFYVPSYQRGYRWGEVEVTRLLDDIYQNGEKNYCLQPVVVRQKGDVYELIDGQQRLTTLYLIYKYIIREVFNNKDGQPAFTLSYQTREQSADFLKTLDMSKKNENIDYWFIANAYETIRNWFEKDIQKKEDLGLEIRRSLGRFVKLIWYEVDESEDAISLFTRLNIGKIPLTSAELVKAMFLSRDNAGNMSREKQEEISLQWDSIERELHNESLWYFLTNSVKNEYQTRIDLVLDLISGKDETSREKYYTFFRFDDMRKVSSLDEMWRMIYQTFLILKGWYEDHDLYHKIGYLIASGIPLHEIFALSKDKKKSEFNDGLDEKIRKSVEIAGNYGELSYEKPQDYKLITTLLLLFNVESVRKADGHAQRFPFDKFKHNTNSNVTWSLEHIHAQQSEGMKTQEVWKEWLRLHIPSVKHIGGDHSELIRRMEETAAKEYRLVRTAFDDIQQKVIALLSTSGSTEYMHSIANLALLNTADNAALSNSTFDVKRNEIIELDKKGQYIPFCTKMVFLKYYTPSEDTQIHFWGQADRIAYIKAINETLADYVEPIVLGKEEAK